MLEGLTRGYAVVAVNYRLSWEALFPALIYDIKAAIRWIRANAEQYHFDLERIAAWGIDQVYTFQPVSGIGPLDDLVAPFG